MIKRKPITLKGLRDCRNDLFLSIVYLITETEMSVKIIKTARQLVK